jgi:hypothetical protein
MKKILLFLLILFLASPAWGMREIGYDDPIHPNVNTTVSDVIVYSGTITGLTISAVNGTAFVDGLNATVLALPLDATHSIEIYDSSNRFLRGVLKSVGVAETAGSELITGWTNSTSHPYETFTAGVGNLITEAANTTAYGSAYKTSTAGIGALYQYSKTVVINSGVDVSTTFFRWASGDNAASPSILLPVSSGYATAASAYSHIVLFVGNGVITNFTVSAISLKQVLTPSSSGAVIQASKTDSTENFGYRDASFTYNAASYRVDVKKLR